MKKQADTTAARRDPKVAAALHSDRIAELVAKIAEAAKADAIEPNWGNVGSLGHARELLVQAAFALGAIDETEAHDVDGVSL